MMKVSGMYVSPFEVEGVLQSHPDVLEAAVVGWPDNDKLIKPKAFVVLKSPRTKPQRDFARALQEHCRKKLAIYKYPRWIEFRTELPKTATGKIQRFKLRAEAEGKMTNLFRHPEAALEGYGRGARAGALRGSLRCAPQGDGPVSIQRLDLHDRRAVIAADP